ncbi:hypothetical protein FRC07_013066, partial [Ceratobasidium sp. 392]
MSKQVPPPYDTSNEEDIRERLRKLESLLQPRADASARGDTVELAATDEQIACAIQPISQACPEGENRTYWQNTLQKPPTRNAQDKENILMPLAKGLGILFAAPLALAGGAIFASGAILYGVGKVLEGLGNLLTFGVLR